MNAQVAHFSITGEALVRHARDVLRSDNPAHAYRILTTALIGDGAEDAALKILRGTHTLTGDSGPAGMRLVKQRKCKALTAFVDSLRYIYAGRIRIHGKWMRPSAWIVAFGEVDHRWALEHCGSTGIRDRNRALYYAQSNRAAHELRIPDIETETAWVIFEPCNERPFWENPPTTPQEALDEALAEGRRLDALHPPTPGYRRLRDDDLDDEDDDEGDSRSEGERTFDALVHSTLVSHGWVKPTPEEQEAMDRHEQAFEAELVRIRDTVRAQAGDDTFELQIADGRVLTIPRAPFMHWALERTAFASAAPPWNTVSRSGMKLDNDSAMHTDWWLGAGLTLEDYRRGVVDPISKAAYEKMGEIQDEAREAATPKPKFAGIFAALDNVRASRHKATVIVDHGERTGVVGEDIAVLSDSEPRPDAEISKYKGIVVERGGPLAHVAIISRGCEITLMLLKDACSLLTPGMTVTLNPSQGRITILDTAPAETES